jgi:hypothetical protein
MEDAMIQRCARLLAWLDRAIDPYPGCLERVVGLKAGIRRLQAHIVEFRIGLAELRVVLTPRRRSVRGRRNGRAVARPASAQH